MVTEEVTDRRTSHNRGGPSMRRVQARCPVARSSNRASEPVTPTGGRRRHSAGVYLTSDFMTSRSPTTAGRTSQVTAVTATLAHCSLVREPLNRAAWA